MREITGDHDPRFTMPDMCQNRNCPAPCITYPDDYLEVNNGLADGLKAYYRCALCNWGWSCYWAKSWVFPQEITRNHGRSTTRELDKRGTLSSSVKERQVDAVPERRQRSTSSGFVYVVRCGKYCKIGYSKTPDRRIANLQIGSPETLVLLGTIEGTKDTETQLHAQFQGKHVRGEWFNLTEDDVKLILGTPPL